MSAAQIAKLLPFKGIPSYDRQIEELESEISKVDGVTAAEFKAVNDAQDAEIDDKAEAVIGAARPIVYLGGPLANDANNGETAITPVSSLVQILKEADLTKPLVIEVLGDFEVSELFGLQNANANIELRNRTGDLATMKFTGTGRLTFRAAVNLALTSIRVLYDKTDNKSAISMLHNGALHFSACEVDVSDEAAANSTAPVLDISPFTNLFRFSTLLSESAETRFFNEFISVDHSNRYYSNN